MSPLAVAPALLGAGVSGIGGLPNATALALFCGIALLVSALGWRAVRLVRVRHGVRAGLTSADPVMRCEAIRESGELGLDSTAGVLLHLVRAEKNPAVLAEMVRTVAARQWEPASTGRIVELRLWAKAYVDRHPELRRTAGGSPLLPGVPGTVPPPSLDPLRADEFRTRADQVHAPGSAHPAGTLTASGFRPPDDDPLSPVRVLVTGAGGPAGIAVIQSLVAHGHHVIAADADPFAAGLRLAHEHHVLPTSGDPHYLAALLRAATVSTAQALICTVTEEYPAIVGAKEYLDDAGLSTLLPSLDATERCEDKWSFFLTLTEAGLAVPMTALRTDQGVPGPWIVKPRRGRGSRDVVACQTRTQLASALRVVPDAMVQTLLPGREFTCDALVDASGALVATAPRWRLVTKAGISTRGETFHDEEVTTMVGLVLKAVDHIGPANVQGFVAEDGEVTVIEVNARFSGGLPLTIAAGADVVEEYLRGILGLAMRPERLVTRPGVMMMRYFCEVYAGLDD
jgi:carbamoylphosphate synthase large subunit